MENVNYFYILEEVIGVWWYLLESKTNEPQNRSFKKRNVYIGDAVISDRFVGRPDSVHRHFVGFVKRFRSHFSFANFFFFFLSSSLFMQHLFYTSLALSPLIMFCFYFSISAVRFFLGQFRTFIARLQFGCVLWIIVITKEYFK